MKHSDMVIIQPLCLFLQQGHSQSVITQTTNTMTPNNKKTTVRREIMQQLTSNSVNWE